MNYPLIPPLLAYLIGILVGIYVDVQCDRWLLLSLFVVISITLGTFLALRRTWRGALLCALVCLVGILGVRLRIDPEFPSDHIVHAANGVPVLLEGTLCQEPQWGNEYTRLVLRCAMLRQLGGDRPVFGKAELFVPERIDDLTLGDTLILEARLKVPHNYGNPGEFDQRRQSHLRGVYVQGSIADSFHIVRVGHTGASAIPRTIAKVRSHLGDFFQKVDDPEARGLLFGLILGDRSRIPEEVLDSFRTTGLAHLLAISGLHVGLVGLFAYAFIKALLKRSVWILLNWEVQKLALLGSIPFLLWYVLVAGAPLTAVRALLMALMLVGALMLNRVHAIWNAVALAALLILFVEPGALFTPGFQLSFGAVVCILVLVPRLKTRLFERHDSTNDSVRASWKRRLRRTVSELVCVSLAATVGTAPLIAYHFHQVSLVSLLANILVVPLVGWVAIPCALAASVLSFVHHNIGSVPLQISGWVLEGVVWVVGMLERMPRSSIRVGSPTLWELFSLYGIVLLVLWRKEYRWKMWAVLSLCLFLASSLLWAWMGPRLSKELRVTFLSVGQGQSILIEVPGGTRMLLDGGMAREGVYDVGERIVAPYLWRRRIMRIDYLVVSHAQSDHYGGLGYIADNFRPREIWTGPLMGDEEEGYGCFLARCQRKGITHRVLYADMDPLTVQGIAIRVLNPILPETRQGSTSAIVRTQNTNDQSLVLQVLHRDISFLFTGDIERPAEDWMANHYGALIGSTILNVPHHGSRTSSTESFLTRVCPRVAVVSVGRGNRFGLPSKAVMDRYRGLGIPVLRTDLHGAIGVRSDGREVVVQPYSHSKEESEDSSWGRPVDAQDALSP